MRMSYMMELAFHFTKTFRKKKKTREITYATQGWETLSNQDRTLGNNKKNKTHLTIFMATHM